MNSIGPLVREPTCPPEKLIFMSTATDGPNCSTPFICTSPRPATDAVPLNWTVWADADFMFDLAAPTAASGVSPVGRLSWPPRAHATSSASSPAAATRKMRLSALGPVGITAILPPVSPGVFPKGTRRAGAVGAGRTIPDGLPTRDGLRYARSIDQQTRDSYDRIAGAYADHLLDELDHKPLDRALLAAFEATAPAGPIADLGCGPGHVARYLHGRGRHLIGIDLSPEMVEIARRSSPGPEYRVGTMLNLDLAECSLAGAISLYFYFHAPDSVRRLLEDAGLSIEWDLRREPFGGEVQTQRCYLLARRSLVVLRPATEADREFLRSLHHACYRRWVEPIWGWDELDQDRRFGETFSVAGCSIIELAGEPIGTLKTSNQDRWHFVEDIEVEPGHQGRGIGTHVLRGVLAEADRAHLPVRLRVLHTNPARRLYERLGFEIEGETATHALMVRQPADPG